MSRLIDADELKDKVIHESNRLGSYGYMDTKSIIDLIDDVPTIEPPQWFPTTELLPKNDDWVVVTVLDESGDTPYRYTHFGWYLKAADCWIVDAEQRNDVIAWMPLPEPWKGVSPDGNR